MEIQVESVPSSLCSQISVLSFLFPQGGGEGMLLHMIILKLSNPKLLLTYTIKTLLNIYPTSFYGDIVGSVKQDIK